MRHFSLLPVLVAAVLSHVYDPSRARVLSRASCVRRRHVSWHRVTPPPPPSPLKQNLMVHSGFQQLYKQKSVQGIDSPKETVHRLIAEHKGTLEKVTVIGHSLGGGKRVGGVVTVARRGTQFRRIPEFSFERRWVRRSLGRKVLDWL